ncbi:hypothetical protein E5676_scaffold610G00390 [Cucumis melo var. makuwa]|uniref:Uncharacterized protein n=1 Tax=Cucumis melo var. makuwa TaxID=1194695 RepID=A0A5D3DKK2_CUCMM|nr:hypothetical protein E6C27_scaffold174G00540 [Cucumis melo var. makuwa]TYK24137.1 hypothetical protein E5676_scaffold610G00390 [Cucumis melo var. makuwa]
MLRPCVSEVTLRFWAVTTSIVGVNSPLFGSVVGLLVMKLCRGGTKSSKTSCVDALGFELRRSIVRRFSIDCGVTDSFICGVAYLTGMVSFGIPRLICVSFEITRLTYASFGITRLICVSFRITRLICASFGITRLICVSFGVTRLICASFGITRLICKGMARGKPTRARRMREGHMDASSFFMFSLTYL